MLSVSVLLLHDSTHTARKTQELLQKFKWEVCSHLPYNPDLAPNLFSKLLSGTNSDVKTAAENCLKEKGREFYQTGLNELILRSDKCLNRFGDYLEK
ncbi:hypothetical protein AVEN_86456-1 [Araneus ventricosus]|uniref:Uncharacterized protein n=1 Tax=Araneus ventricosus TaxID=182803 RepID=A0A4Y2HTQ5_ARAVE|nr:hypothetical protein AVEN_86456-1 [Araneus ventricosus]